jgi:hypothetical protein
MCSLKGFSAFPPVEHVTLCEVEGKVHSMPAEEADILIFTNRVSFTLFQGILLLLSDLMYVAH